MSSSTGAAPTTVTASFWFWIASVVVSVVAVIITISAGNYAMADIGDNEQVARTVAPIAAVAIILTIVAAVLMYLPASNPYFRRSS